ncbi:MAG: hypothetical protein ACK41W_13105 [Cyanobacteriota bacterium]|jgi:hypothetical protein
MSRVPRKGFLLLEALALPCPNPPPPAAASCRQIDQAAAAQFTECESLSTGQAFGLTFPFHSCQASGGGDDLIYATRAQCEEALNTMKANAP